MKHKKRNKHKTKTESEKKMPRIRIWKRRIIVSTVLMAALCFGFRVLRIKFDGSKPCFLHPGTEHVIEFHSLVLKIDRHIHIAVTSSDDNKSVLEGIIGNSLDRKPNEVLKDEQGVNITWGSHAKLYIRHNAYGTRGQCYNITWSGHRNAVQEFDDVFCLHPHHWYGSGHVFSQPWPIEGWDRRLAPYVTGESFPYWDEGYNGGLLERYWLASSGAAIYVDFDVPLFVSLNHKKDKRLRLVAKYAAPYLRRKDTPLWLNYSICIGKDLKHTHQLAAGLFFAKPTGIPDKRMFRYPVWSTWARYHADVNQSLVLTYAREIRKYGFKDSQFSVDDDWTPHYGDHYFDPIKFPDPKAMVTEMKDLGFRIALWMHPFASIFSKAFYDGAASDRKHWVRLFGLPAVWIWWDGLGGLLDVTNPKAVEWYLNKMNELKMEYGIDSFKFDGGEASRISAWYDTHIPLYNPNTYSILFAEITYQSDTDLRCQETRVGTRVQHLPMFFRFQDKDSGWGYFNGLRTLIPHAVNQGIIGYPFVLPDMVGGNAYVVTGSPPEKELFIRWLQVNTLMPAMQFSLPPWSYDEEVVRITQKMCQLHELYADEFIRLAEAATQTGSPIIRPLWWIAPFDETSLTIDSEFLVGDDLLVAPVLEKGKTSRDVYLPMGEWKDELRGVVMRSVGQWFANYAAALDELPHFTRLTKGNNR